MGSEGLFPPVLVGYPTGMHTGPSPMREDLSDLTSPEP